MIGIILNDRIGNTSIENIDMTANKLLLMTSNVVLSANKKNYESLKNYFKEKENIQVISEHGEFQNCGALTDVYSASCQFPKMTDFLTLSTKYCNLNQEVISTLADNQNSYAVTTTNSFYTISHFSIDQENLVPYLNLENFSFKDFIVDELQCLPITFVKSDID
ncbi:molybdenum cofactor guanylyltransferase [Companilactobacillus insicii]|uniref:molybdenum cofactor guanylyltransferase n=1 Tax=Companilactobacillus insicii TaxID=1732567 RepID=UPI000F76670F|nr:molybdenum cofactor guanylyltransferase [Companilactobacillus insicii]